MTGSVLVFGDVMLDVFEHGEVSRVSPEAPVVILKNPRTKKALGGAANTAANARALGVAVYLLGLIGDDDAGQDCIELTRESGIDAILVTTPAHPTTVKRRFLAGNHQIMRLDVEAASSPQSVLDELMTAASARIVDSGAVVISDYDKGTVSDLVAANLVASARYRGVPVVVDSKRLDVNCFAGCSVIAPNHHEAQRITGFADPRRSAEAIAKVTGSAVLITLGADGMLLFERSTFTEIPSDAVEVSDVTGAGDTVTAALAVALAEGASLIEAAKWANAAAAHAVAHPGTYAVRRSDVRPLAI